MSAMTLSKLVEKLTPSCRQTLESAASICHSRSQFTVEIEHWLLAILEKELGDLQLIMASFSVEKSMLKYFVSIPLLFFTKFFIFFATVGLIDPSNPPLFKIFIMSSGFVNIKVSSSKSFNISSAFSAFLEPILLFASVSFF